MFHTTPFSADEEIVRIDKIVKGFNSNDIVDVYLKYVPYVIKYRLEKTLPYPEALSCNSDGVIKIVHYKKFLKQINKRMRQYCYELESEESFEDRNGESVVILKYKLNVENV